MSSKPYIPRADKNFRTWAENYVRTLILYPYRYGVEPPIAAQLLKWYEDFDAAFRRVSGDNTRTRSAIVAKQDARSILESACRDIAAVIRSNKGVDDEGLITLGLPARNVGRRKRWCPQIAPSLSFIGITPGFDVLLVESPISTSKGKPYGAARVELWAAYTEPGSKQWPRIKDAKFLFSHRKGKKIYVARDHETADWPGTYWARYAGHNDDVGPFSHPTSWKIATKQAHEEQMKTAKKHEEAGGDDALKMAA